METEEPCSWVAVEQVEGDGKSQSLLEGKSGWVGVGAKAGGMGPLKAPVLTEPPCLPIRVVTYRYPARENE